MKKHILLITALTIAMAILPAASKEIFESPEELENFDEYFYEAPITPVPEVKVVEGSTMKPVRGMPVFKKTRIKVTNYLRERDYKKTQKLLKKEEVVEENDTNEVNVNYQDADDTLELEGGVKQHVAANDVLLDAENIDYDEKTFDITATGSPVLVFPPQNVTVKADKMIYNKASNVLKAFGNVEVIRSGNHIFGEYMQINMNEETAFLDNMKTKVSAMSANAQQAEMDGDKIILHNGKMVSEDSYILDLHTRMIGGNHFNTMMIDEDMRSSLAKEIGDTAVNIKAKEVKVNAKKGVDVITLKKAKINYGGVDLWKVPSFSVHTGKNHDFFEANYPEFGSRARIGMFAGPGFVVDTPLQGGSVLKLIPIINNKSGIGFGGLAKYRSATNHTEFGYGSSADVFILKGKQYFDDKLYMQYGANSYMDEWFLGRRMPKYTAELIYRDKGVIPSTIGKNLNLNFEHRFGVGYMQNNDTNRHGEHIPAANMGTMRTRYMAQASQSLFSYVDKEKLRLVNLSLTMQGSAALYGTGDTQFIGRVGPMLKTQYRHWMQDIGYFATAYQDNSPMQMYDCYRYGKGSVIIREALRVNKYLTLAWSGSITLTGDSPNGDMFQENSFIVALGPDDFKFNIGYDWVRRQTYFSVLIAMDTKGSSIEYERMEIKNADKLAKSNQEEVELKVFDTENPKTEIVQPQKMMYAEVIDIEDPDREQI